MAMAQNFTQLRATGHDKSKPKEVPGWYPKMAALWKVIPPNMVIIGFDQFLCSFEMAYLCVPGQRSLDLLLENKDIQGHTRTYDRFS